MMPEILRIGGNQRDGLLSVQRRGEELVVVSYPTGVPTHHDEIVLLRLPYSEQSKRTVLDQWDTETGYRRQLLSHIGEDVIEFEPGEIEGLHH